MSKFLSVTLLSLLLLSSCKEETPYFDWQAMEAGHTQQAYQDLVKREQENTLGELDLPTRNQLLSLADHTSNDEWLIRTFLRFEEPLIHQTILREPYLSQIHLNMGDYFDQNPEHFLEILNELNLPAEALTSKMDNSSIDLISLHTRLDRWKKRASMILAMELPVEQKSRILKLVNDRVEELTLQLKPVKKVATPFNWKEILNGNSAGQYILMRKQIAQQGCEDFPQPDTAQLDQLISGVNDENEWAYKNLLTASAAQCLYSPTLRQRIDVAIATSNLLDRSPEKIIHWLKDMDKALPETPNPIWQASDFEIYFTSLPDTAEKDLSSRKTTLEMRLAVFDRPETQLRCDLNTGQADEAKDSGVCQRRIGYILDEKLSKTRHQMTE